MKVIIAGGRNIFNYKAVKKAIADSGFVITEVVSGKATGVDALGEKWARENSIPVKDFPANWNRYRKKAGPIRNGLMAEYADALILVWDGESSGSANMLKQACAKRSMKIWNEVI